MSESTTETPADSTEPIEPQGDPSAAKAPEQEIEDLRKALKSANEEAKRFRLKLKEHEDASLSDLEKAQRQAQEAQATAEKAAAEALRYRVAAKHGITDEDAELFLTGSDAETLERQAARLGERTPTAPKPDPSQGAKGSDSKATTADMFAAAVEGAFTR